MVSDRYAACAFVAPTQRQVCWVHLIRDLLRAYSTPSRTPFHSDGGQHSAVMADTVPR
jgi:transposase-like protein